MMQIRTLWQTLAILSFTLFFVLVRIGAAEHSAQFGSGPHHHDGKICAVSLVAHDDENDLLPTDTTPAAAFITRYYVAFNYTVLSVHAPDIIPFIKTSARSPPTL